MSEIKKQEDERRYTIDDIKSAETVGDALHAYRKSCEQRSSLSGLNTYQEAVASRAHELGDEQTSKEFTILSIQTTNNERFLRGVDMLGEISQSLQTTGNRILDGGEEFKRGAGQVHEAMDQFRADAGRIATAGNQISEASGVIDRASYRMQNG